MTERQAYNELEARLPPDAWIDVVRRGWCDRWKGGRFYRRTSWSIRIVHLATGYERRHAVKEWSGRKAIDVTMAKWDRHQRRRESLGVTDRLKIGGRVYRVRVRADRLFFNEGNGPEECAAIVDERRRLVDVAGCVPKELRPLAAEAAVEAPDEWRRAA